MKTKSEGKTITIVVPVFNEEKNIPLLIQRLNRNLAGLIAYKVLFVDDGSSDRTLNVIKQEREKADNIYYLSFSKNFGHQNALKAGIDKADGDAIITLDGDLQHPPELIPKMIALWQNGFDIVYTCRDDEQSIGRFKKASSAMFYRLLRLISKLDLQPGTADFRLIDRRALDSLRLFDEVDLFFRGIIAGLGFKQTALTYQPEKRLHGTTKYSLRKMAALAVSGITGFSIFPLRALTVIGFLFSMGSFIYGLYALAIRFFTNEAVPGWTSIMAGIYFLGGLQLGALGICGEYIGKIFLEVKKRPHYLVAESLLPEDDVTLPPPTGQQASACRE